MRIVVDVRALQGGSRYRGIGVYVRHLLYHLSLLDHDNQYLLMFEKNRPRPEMRLAPGFHAEDFPIRALPAALHRLNIFFDYLFLHRQVARARPDVVHFTSPIEPEQHFALHELNHKVVATIHDLTPFHHADEIFVGKRRLLHPLFRWLLASYRNVAHVVADSAYSRADLIRECGLPPERVTVALLGGTEAVVEGPDPPGAPRPALAPGYLLYVGAASPTKNVDLLVRLLPALAERHGLRPELAIAGALSPEHRQRLEAVARAQGCADQVRFLGYVPFGELEKLYAECGCVLYPSLSEGFGIPALEAMQGGAALISSNACSLPEVVGDAGILQPPRDLDAWVEAVARVLTDRELAADLGARGRERARRFNWDETARRTLEAYRRVAQDPPRPPKPGTVYRIFHHNLDCDEIFCRLSPVFQAPALLRVLLAVTRRLPPVRGAGVVSVWLRRLYNRRPRPPVRTRLRLAGETFDLELDPREDVDGNLLFHPQLYDRDELAFLQAHLPRGGTFVDVGSNIGIYTLVAARAVGAGGRVLAVEADPYTRERLARNLALSGLENAAILPLGVSDRRERLRLAVNTEGNRGGSSFMTDSAEGVEVDCLPLHEALQEAGVTRIDAMKCDIEGFEYRVLRHFFEHAPPSLWPRAAVVESFGPERQSGGGDPIALMLDRGYRLAERRKQNYMLLRDAI